MREWTWRRPCPRITRTFSRSWHSHPTNSKFCVNVCETCPDLSSTNTEPLFHNLEADLPHTTGGDLALVPPILSKYWGHFLTEGPFGTWEQAAGWLQSLAKEDRVVAGKFLGFEHLDLRHYQDIPAFSPVKRPAGNGVRNPGRRGAPEADRPGGAVRPACRRPPA